MESLKNKVIIITDASSPVGQSCVQVLMNYGVNVIACGEDKASLQRMQKEAGDGDQNKLSVFPYMKQNMEESVKQIVNSVVAKHKRINGLVFSKDDEFKGTFRDSSVEYLNSSLESLVEPLICWYQLTRSHLLASKGSYAILSSAAASQLSVGNLPYSVSKAGLNMFTKLIAMENAHHGVTVNSVNPRCQEVKKISYKVSLTAVPRLNTDNLFLQQESASDSPLTSGVTHEEVAEHIAYLMTDVAKFCTGRNILLDGSTPV